MIGPFAYLLSESIGSYCLYAAVWPALRGAMRKSVGIPAFDNK